MRTIFIRGIDTSGVPPDAEEKPLGTFDRADPASMVTEVDEMIGIAEIQGIAVGQRGRRDPGQAHLPVFRAALESYVTPLAWERPALLPFLDTGALRDIVNYDHPGQPITFDFLNESHLASFWTDFVLPFYEAFQEGANVPNPIRFERTPDGRLVILVWSIAPGLNTAVNQIHAQQVLEYVALKMGAVGLGKPAFIVDQSWLVAADLNVFGVHRWFAPWNNEAYSLYTHHGVTTGVAVPGFHVASQPTWIIDRQNGQTLRFGLGAMRAAVADYVFLESYNNLIERAGFYRSDAWSPSTLYLDIVREHMALTSPEPIPEPEPEPIPIYGDSMIVLTDLSDGTSKVYDNLIDNGDDTFTLIYPTPGGPTVASLQPNGTLSTRLLNAPPAPPGVEFDHKVHGLGGVPGVWEKGRKKDGKYVLRTEGVAKVYGLIEGV